MKKLLLLIVVASMFLSISKSINAQHKNYAAKINLVGIIGSQYQGAFEAALNEHSAVQLSAGIINRTWSISSGAYDGDYEIGPKGFIVIPEYRYYFNDALKGGYIGGFARYRDVKQKVTDNLDDGVDWSYERKKTSVGGGIVGGVQLLISDAIVFDIFAGPQYKSVTKGDWEFVVDGVDEDDFTISVDEKGDKDGIGVRFGFNLGIAF